MCYRLILDTPDPVSRELTEVALKAVCYLALKGEDLRHKQFAVVFNNRRAMQRSLQEIESSSITGSASDDTSNVLEAAPHMFAVTAIVRIPPPTPLFSIAVQERPFRDRTLIGTQ